MAEIWSGLLKEHFEFKNSFEFRNSECGIAAMEMLLLRGYGCMNAPLIKTAHSARMSVTYFVMDVQALKDFDSMPRLSDVPISRSPDQPITGSPDLQDLTRSPNPLK